MSRILYERYKTSVSVDSALCCVRHTLKGMAVGEQQISSIITDLEKRLDRATYCSTATAFEATEFY